MGLAYATLTARGTTSLPAAAPGVASLVMIMAIWSRGLWPGADTALTAGTSSPATGRCLESCGGLPYQACAASVNVSGLWVGSALTDSAPAFPAFMAFLLPRCCLPSWWCHRAPLCCVAPAQAWCSHSVCWRGRLHSLCCCRLQPAKQPACRPAQKRGKWGCPRQPLPKQERTQWQAPCHGCSGQWLQRRPPMGCCISPHQ